jgi:hypothetical protein
VILSWIDILITSVGIAAIGYLIALLPVSMLTRKPDGDFPS